MKPLNILEIQPYSNGEVSSDSSGGIEQLAYILDKKLNDFGHKTKMICRTGSDIIGEMIQTNPAWYDQSIIQKPDGLERAVTAYTRLILRQDFSEFDILLNHMSDILAYTEDIPIPVVTVLHMSPAYFWDQNIFGVLSPKNKYVAVSGTVQKMYEQIGIESTVIANGIDVDKFEFSKDKDDFLLYLGRIVPEKGVDVAVQIAKESNRNLIIAGGVDSNPQPAHKGYFERILQSIDGKNIRYIGQVGFNEKRELLSRAKALIVPTQNINGCLETSSLVSMEAAASGTPVIATNNGALPETICDGISGLVREDHAGLVRAVHEVEHISPEDCRTIANARFSAGIMAMKYTTYLTSKIR